MGGQAESDAECKRHNHAFALTESGAQNQADARDCDEPEHHQGQSAEDGRRHHRYPATDRGKETE